jgi:hypothetical protein
MITLNDCAAMCVLDHEDLAQIAEYEHIPEVANATLSTYMAHPNAANSNALCKLMIGDIRNALDEGFVHHATEVVMALREFLERNPQAQPGVTIH